MVTNKALISHHYGFGNLDMDRLHGGQIQSKTTALEASGKFKDKLEFKQRKLETHMMENRLRKLNDEE